MGGGESHCGSSDENGFYDDDDHGYLQTDPDVSSNDSDLEVPILGRISSNNPCCTFVDQHSNLKHINQLIPFMAGTFVTREIQTVMRAVIREHFIYNTGAEIHSVHYNKGSVPGEENGNHVCFAPRREVQINTNFADILEALQLRPGHSFLHLGSGTGYLNTLAGLLIGSSGVNHGVEVNAGMLDYAEERQCALRDHCKSLVNFEYCEPTFVLGDCLKLDPSPRYYDRIYCSGMLPEGYDVLLQGFLKRDGILMFAKDPGHHVIDKRNGDAEFIREEQSSASVLHVYPFVTDDSDTVTQLPEKNFPTLQELARSAIRVHLRSTMPGRFVEDSVKRKSEDEEESESDKNTRNQLRKRQRRSESDDASSGNGESSTPVILDETPDDVIPEPAGRLDNVIHPLEFARAIIPPAQPSTSTEQPSKSTEQPSTSTERPSTSTEQPFCNNSASKLTENKDIKTITNELVENVESNSLANVPVPDLIENPEENIGVCEVEVESVVNNIGRPAGESSPDCSDDDDDDDSDSDNTDVFDDSDDFDMFTAPEHQFCEDCFIIKSKSIPKKVKTYEPDEHFGPDTLYGKINKLPLPDNIILYLKYKHNLGVNVE